MLFGREHYAPGLEWDAYAEYLPGWEILGAPADQLDRHLDGVDVLCSFGAPVDAQLLQSGSFGLVQQLGVGLEKVDVEAATAAGVWVARLPAELTGNADGVADTALLLILAALRRLDAARAGLARGGGGPSLRVALWRASRSRWWAWAGRAPPPCSVCVASDVTLSGCARILSGAARTASSASWDRPSYRRSLAMRTSSCCALFEPGAPPLVDAKLLDAVRPGLVLVNVARGGLLDEPALLDALEDGRIGAAGLDVFAHEPVYPQAPLVTHPNVIALPHVAGVTEQMFRQAGRVFADELERWRRHEPPRFAVNEPSRPRGW